jgi:hypothetical protein
MSEQSHSEPADERRALAREFRRRLRATHPELTPLQIAEVARAMATLQLKGRSERDD